ncbi:hypothetical protein BGZ58_009116, partial [Dissophora ornata]
MATQQRIVLFMVSMAHVFFDKFGFTLLIRVVFKSGFHSTCSSLFIPSYKLCDDHYQHETLRYDVNANKVLPFFDQAMIKRTVTNFLKLGQRRSVKTIVALDAEKLSRRELNLADSKNGLFAEQHS